MKTISVTEFKAHCLRLLEESKKTGEPIELTKRGKPFATVTPAASEASYKPGQFRDQFQIVGDIVEPLLSPEEWGVEKEWF
ncbi:type II toxin-antitoxin system Phd/YefM family antitoxin [Fimbriimonas ginsengisoli]|uniref:Antitoxin n=1 Tax=Fimbriimonas ginsengisoli Gsoil 348 TaxID=661478 RepID=A0A068NNE3_FIMGI|nr:type II toxin-antitoxin system Phd/YefM family antitoxin [Fimbriimonas ginsengisoli]AIE84981.1 prevent-host-death protein [Fimbriimonas ginsengisoli Gsoil 348]